MVNRVAKKLGTNHGLTGSIFPFLNHEIPGQYAENSFMFHPEQKLVVYSWNYICQPGRQLSCQIYILYIKLQLVDKLIKQPPVRNHRDAVAKMDIETLDVHQPRRHTESMAFVEVATWKLGRRIHEVKMVHFHGEYLHFTCSYFTCMTFTSSFFISLKRPSFILTPTKK